METIAEVDLVQPLDDGAIAALDDAALLDRIDAAYDALGTLVKRIDEAMKHNANRVGTVDYAGNTNKNADLGLGVEGVDFYEGSLDDVDPSEWQVPQYCIPIHTNVTTYDWNPLANACQFDVIMMDPPWQLATANPTRGVALGYSQLTDKDIENIPIPRLQKDGLLFMWVINAKYQLALDLFEQWGYDLVDEVVWVKMTVNRRLAKSHGFYLQHAKEVCLVGKRGKGVSGMVRGGVGSDILYSERRGQSQKPEGIYELIEKLVPDGRCVLGFREFENSTAAACALHPDSTLTLASFVVRRSSFVVRRSSARYLEIFGRKNNLRNHWVTVGIGVDRRALARSFVSDAHSLTHSLTHSRFARFL